MAKRSRERLVRKHSQAMNDLDRCLTKIQALQVAYAPAHPPQHQMISMIALTVIELQTLLQRFRNEYM